MNHGVVHDSIRHKESTFSRFHYEEEAVRRCRSECATILSLHTETLYTPVVFASTTSISKKLAGSA